MGSLADFKAALSSARNIVVLTGRLMQRVLQTERGLPRAQGFSPPLAGCLAMCSTVASSVILMLLCCITGIRTVC